MATSAKPIMIKPSDAKSWASCKRRVWLENKADFKTVKVDDPFDLLIIELGLAHERAVFDKLSSRFNVRTAVSPEDTRRYMAERVEVIYQAQLVDNMEGIVGYPDFLILHESGDYQAADAKLSQNQEKKEIQIQLGVYRRLLGNGLAAIVYLGNGEEVEIGDEANDVTNQFIGDMHGLLRSEEQPSVRYSHSKCSACPYTSHCKPAFEADEELSLLYRVDGRSVAGLKGEGITTISQLAKADPNLIPDMPYLKGDASKKRAVLQAKAHLTGEVQIVAPVSLPEGQWVHFDIEDNPLTGTGNKHVYLWGFLEPGYRQENFSGIWTDTDDKDQQGWERFLAQVELYRQQYLNLILAHYSSHEKSTIRSYAVRYGMENNETVKYLLGDESPLFDLQVPVLESLVLPLQGYGLKNICKHPDLVNFQWEDSESGSQWSVVQFNRFLTETDLASKEKLKTYILGYNRDDVMATRRLEEWLRESFLA